MKDKEKVSLFSSSVGDEKEEFNITSKRYHSTTFKSLLYLFEIINRLDSETAVKFGSHGMTRIGVDGLVRTPILDH